MKKNEKNLYSEMNFAGQAHIPHEICLADFNTNHPSRNRINRIASEISEYLKNKCKYGDGKKTIYMRTKE